MAAGLKLTAMTKGISPVSISCQIPHLRERYESFGFSPHTGYFVEVGAFDGESYSNTSFLADQGWSGLYIEPVPAFCSIIKLRHLFNLSRVSIENLALAETSGVSELHLMGAYSTSVDPVFEAYKTIPWTMGLAAHCQTVRVRTDTLQTVFRRHSVPVTLDLMVIDVEGGEEPIVSALFESQWRPRVLIIELCDKFPAFSDSPMLQESHASVRKKILRSGYYEDYSDHVNTIFRMHG
jgi:FkbM family methyltransferase